MPKKISPIAINNFPNISTNCLGFAIGNDTPVRESDSLYSLDPNYSISEAFLKKLSELNYEELPRKIESVDEAQENEFIIMVFDFTVFKFKHPFMGWEYYWDYHVVRREINGTWVHKPGWKLPPCEIQTRSDWDAIYNEFGNNYVLFAVSA